MPVLRSRSRGRVAGTGGVVRLDRRTKDLTKRLRPGEVAVIDHLDIDRVSAEALVACRPCAVVNAARSSSGRYPNLGPEILVSAGIPLLDDVGSDVLVDLREGDLAVLEGDELQRPDGTVIAAGHLLDADSVTAAMAEAREGLSLQLEAFASNTMEYLKRERDLLIDGIGVPDIRTPVEGRHVLIVVRGYHYKQDIQTLRPYIREYRPLLIGVDGGADALMEVGYRPDLIVGDMDSVSDTALTSGAEIVVHAYRDGRAPGLARVEALGVTPVVFPATGTSEDIAMLLADDKGADLIVAVGTHATLVEFLDKGRSGMASTFLTRLRVGGKLVDAKGVSRLYRNRVSTLQVVLLVSAGLFALFAALGSTTAGRSMLELLGSWWNDALFWLRGLV
ncbi:MAG: putative cytokinetic ring protein SteA [Actinomycetota bacterium]|nr:putative cytokinetic ring protein SteA [Actinomycetota bacterium]MDH4352437.1 putative cytokinetic ring protein SteA [Actinomycetota bacterium]MDH5277422.1 putative cytokinetic ring protein SteA [Actinomycetota bacterium]